MPVVGAYNLVNIVIIFFIVALIESICYRLKDVWL